MDINHSPRAARYLVPIALGKYLFPFRTQKSSPVAAIILLCGKLARCQIIKESPEREIFCGKGGGGGCRYYYQFEVPKKEINLNFYQDYIFLIRDKDSGEIWFAGKVAQSTPNV